MQREPARSAADLVPRRLSRSALVEAAARCRACPLWEHATQTVFGAGPRRARLMLVGEQPGHQEDLRGEPFVGPAGQLLDACLEEAGIERAEVYVTNVVKHFKWTPKGKLRLHQKPSSREVGACMPWLEAEIELVRPRLLVALGATAAKALLGPTFRVTQERGKLQRGESAPLLLATVHPASVLRRRDDEARRRARAELIADLEVVARELG